MTVLDLSELPVPVLLVDADGGATATPRLLAMLGLDGLEPGALERFEVRGEDGGVLPPERLPWVRAARGDEFEERQRWRHARTGREITLVVHARRSGAGGLLAVEQVADERHLARLAALPGEIAPLLLGAEDPRAASVTVVERVLLAFDAAGSCLLQWEGERLAVLAAAGLGRDSALERLAGVGAQSIAARAVRSGRLEQEPQLAGGRTGAWGEWLQAHGVGSVAAVPLGGAGEVLAVLCLGRRASGPLPAFEESALRSVAQLWTQAVARFRAREFEARARTGMRAITEAALGRDSEMPLRDLLRLLVEQACALTRARYGAMGVLNHDHTDLEDFIVVGVSDEQAARIGHLPSGRGLLGAVISEGRTIRVARIGQDPRSSGFPHHHPPMTSFLGVPLRIGREVYGNFYLTDKDGGAEFTEDDARVLEAFSAQAALTVSYARRTGEQRRMLDAVLRHAPHGILFVTEAEQIAFGNAAAERMLGVSERPATVGRDVQLAAPDGRLLESAERPSLKALRGEVVANQEVRVLRPGERPLPAFASAAPVWSETGALLGAVVVFQDISAFKELERMREEFTAVIAHDLRNPLQAVMMQLDMLLRRADTATATATVPVATLQRMQKSGQRLTHLITDLLDASRIEGNRLSLDRKPVDLPDAVTALVRQIEMTLGDHVVTLRVDGAPPRVLADPLRLDQVLTNLIENAAKYSGERSPIELTVAPSGSGAAVSVSDRGPGILPEDMPRLFDRYYQARRAREKKRGLGLGLFITKGLVDAHGGRLWVESTPGHGSTFHLWLPAAGDDTGHAEAVPQGS